MIPLSLLAGQVFNGAIPLVIGVPCAGVGILVARRQPRNPIGWLFLVTAACLFLSTDGPDYALLTYRLGHHLPLGPVGPVLGELWGPGLTLLFVVILLFPDGRLPSRFWRWTLRIFCAAYAVLQVATAVATADAIAAHPIRVDANGGLSALGTPAGWYDLVQGSAIVVLVVLSLCFVGRQVLSWRRASSERRQQLKWLASGAAVTLVCAVLSTSLTSSGTTLLSLVGNYAWFGWAALPVSIGVAILKYRLYDIDRIISRTLAYAIVTGLLVGVYAGLVLLATQALPVSLSTPVAVACATLVAAALFNPLRRRVQRAVDRRFNRARYDADKTVTAFAVRLQDAVDLDTVQADLAGVVHAALEPAHVSAVDQGRRAVTADMGPGRFRLASPAIALVFGGLVLALMIGEAPLAGLAHQSVNAAGGSVPVWFSAAFAVVGFVVAWRKPGNPLGWIILAVAGFFALSEDASFYAVADYRLQHGGLPLGWVALLAQPGWAPAIVLLGLVVLLFPDGQPPSPRWRWVLWAYAAVGALWIVGAVTASLIAIADHNVQVDAGGNLAALDYSTGYGAWWGVVSGVFFVLLAVCWLASLAGEALSYRRSSGERRQQLKWLISGSAVAGAALLVTYALNSRFGILQILGEIALAGVLAIPVSIGVAVLKYRLFDIDRIISRTLAYAIVTGLLIGVYAAIVLLATRVVSITTPVAVAASTLAAAALFNPLRRRVQRAVDRRFNRARYDADKTIAAFAARLQDAVDLDTVQADLTGVVHHALEPAHVSVWISQRG